MQNREGQTIPSATFKTRANGEFPESFPLGKKLGKKPGRPRDELRLKHADARR